MKKIMITFLIFILTINLYSEELQNDPFELDLDNYESQRKIGSDTMLYSSIVLGIGFIAGSSFSTFNSMGMLDNDISTPGVISSYTTVSLSAITIVVGFLIWKNSTEKYLDTLRLQTQYYNLVEY